MPKFSAGALAVASIVGACVPHATYTPRVKGCEKRAAKCSFDVLASRPARDYAVIGVIDIESFHVGNAPRNEDEFRSALADEVCLAGGDAVLPGINGNGRYVLATVVKWADDGAMKPVCSLSDAESKQMADGAP